MRQKRNISWISGVKRWAAIAGAAWLFVVFVYRFVNPPVTPLIAIRYVQSVWSGTDRPQSLSWVPLTSIPTPVQQAVVAAEDSRFMNHWGVDLGAIGTVLDQTDGRRRLRGASTITMQTVKNLFLWPGRSYIRKFLEALMAPVAGFVWGKRRTLEIYLNVIEWGDGIYGIEEAAQEYFQHSAKDLTVSEAAALASILPNPRKLSPAFMSHVTRRRYDRILREWKGVQVPVSYHPRGRRSK
jgi:monofunctional biosynthetic peptidoglycan transglycosylase